MLLFSIGNVDDSGPCQDGAANVKNTDQKLETKSNKTSTCIQKSRINFIYTEMLSLCLNSFFSFFSLEPFYFSIMSLSIYLQNLLNLQLFILKCSLFPSCPFIESKFKVLIFQPNTKEQEHKVLKWLWCK